jgi:hypothetical protein
MNNETHSEEIQHIVSQYFLTQRIKSDGQGDAEAIKSYHEKLKLCHQLLVYSMQAKQTTDITMIEKLRSVVQIFKKSYFGEKKISSHRSARMRYIHSSRCFGDSFNQSRMKGIQPVFKGNYGKQVDMSFMLIYPDPLFATEPLLG